MLCAKLASLRHFFPLLGKILVSRVLPAYRKKRLDDFQLKHGPVFLGQPVIRYCTPHPQVPVIWVITSNFRGTSNLWRALNRGKAGKEGETEKEEETGKIGSVAGKAGVTEREQKTGKAGLEGNTRKSEFSRQDGSGGTY